MPLGQLGEGGDDERGGRAGERADDDPTADGLVFRGELGLGDIELGKHAVGALDEAAGGRAEPHAPAVPFEQRHPDLALELRERLRDRGRGVADRSCDLGDRAALGEFAEEAEASQVEHRSAQLTLRRSYPYLRLPYSACMRPPQSAPAEERLGFFERLGAWLGVWTPPRGVAVPPPPWRAIGIGAALLVGLIGTAALIAVPEIAGDREADRARSERAEAQRRAAFLAYLDREQTPRRGSAEPDPGGGAGAARREVVRIALVASAATAVARDARRRTGKAIEQAAECQPFPRTLNRVDPAEDLSRRNAAYDCTAVTNRFGTEGEAGGRGITGIPFRLIVDFGRGSFAWCRIVPLGDRDRLSIPLPDACRLSGSGHE
jgi:hypothetical protein